MRGVLRKWTARDKFFKLQNLPARFRLSLFRERLGEI